MLTPEEQERLLLRHVMLSRSGDEVLHTQLTRALRHLIVNYFEDGERFYTEEDLGGKLGLSVGTVRRSLNRLVDDGLLTRSRGKGSFVRKAINTPGEGLRVIAVVNTFDSPFNSLLLREISYLCQCRRYSLELINPCQDERVSRALEVGDVSGARIGFLFLCLDPDFTCDLTRTAQSRGIPSVNIDTWIPGYPGVQVCVDNRIGMDMGVAHLHELGHRHVALLLCEQPDHENIRERTLAFEEALAARGMTGTKVMMSPSPDFEGLSEVMRFPTQERYNANIDARVADRVVLTGASAVFCVSDIGAAFLMKRLQMTGRRIPEDISVMGFNDEGSALMLYPELTTIAQPYPEIASVALGFLERFDASTRHIRLIPSLAARKSTGAPCAHCV